MAILLFAPATNVVRKRTIPAPAPDYYSYLSESAGWAKAGELRAQMDIHNRLKIA